MKNFVYFQPLNLLAMAMSSVNLGSTTRLQATEQPTNYPALTTLITVFFFWGFIAAGNSIFIPFCRNYFHLDQFQSQLIDFAFYLAYYVGALILFAYGAFGGKDLVGKWGYKRSIVFGLLFSAIGAVAMIIAVKGDTFTGMLAGLFIVALGFSLQQTAAQPFAIALGDPSTGTSRVNLGGGVNSFGTAIGPIVVALALFGTTAAANDDAIKSLSLDKVIIMYSCVGALFLGAAALFFFSKKVPAGILLEDTEKANKALYTLLIMSGLLIIMFVPVFNSYKGDLTNLSATDKHNLETYRMEWLFGALAVVVIGLLIAYMRANKNAEGWGAMKYPQLVLGMLALFVYVGVEVTIGSNMSELLKQKDFGGFQSSQVAPFISMYWGGIMIGRWAGSLSAFKMKKSTKNILIFVLPLLAFGVVIGVNTVAKNDMRPLYYYFVCVLIQIGAFYLSKDNPARTLLIFSVLGVTGMLVGIFNTGTVGIYALLSGGLFCSIMWPAIFALSVAGLGKYTTQGAAFLIMMILGGGIIPPIQGKLADFLQSKSDIAGVGIHQSYWVPVVCFAYLAVFAVAVKGILRKQGIDYDKPLLSEVESTSPEGALEV